MAAKIPFNVNNAEYFEQQSAGDGRIILTEKRRGEHFWPIYTLLCGLVFAGLCGGIVWGLATGHIKDGADSDVPPMGLLLLIAGGMGAVCFWAAFLHFRQHKRKGRHAPAILNLPDPLRGGQSARLSFGKKLLRPGQADHQPGEVQARLELTEFMREAPRNDEDDREDAQGKYSVSARPVWQENLRSVPVAADADFAAEWVLMPPELARVGFRPNALFGQLQLTITLRRGDQEYVEPYRVFLRLE